MNEELKPCPFCNYAEVFEMPIMFNDEVSYRYQVSCECKNWFESKQEAIEAWNKRA